MLLLRELGIPARYAVGYAVHEPSGHGYVVRERDAHAWCLVWDEATQTWEDFDTTPGVLGRRGRQTRVVHAMVFGFLVWARFQIAKFRWGQTNLRRYILWTLIPVLAVLLFQIIFRRGRKRRSQHRRPESPKPRFSGRDLIPNSTCSNASWPRAAWRASRANRFPTGCRARWTDPALADLRQPLQELLRLHYRHRFDPRGLSGEERETLTREAKNCLDTLSQIERPIAHQPRE